MSSNRVHFATRNTDPFFTALKVRSAAIINDPQLKINATRKILAKGFLWTALFVISYCGMYYTQSGFIALLCGTIAALAGLFLGFGLAHDAAHHALTIPRRLQDLLFSFAMLPTGIDSYLWRMRHLGSHHIIPNVKGSDADIDDNPFVRLSPHHPRRWYQKYQVWYACFLYAIVIPYTVLIEDFIYLKKSELANMKNIKIPTSELIAFFLRKCIYLGLWIILPFALLQYHWYWILFGYFFVSAIISNAFVFGSAGTHFSSLAEYPVPNDSHQLQGTWAHHQLATSVDFSPGSRLALFLTGGFNCHAAHHLFPSTPHPLYGDLTVIIAETAAEFNLPYKATSFFGMIGAHFEHLRLMAVTD